MQNLVNGSFLFQSARKHTHRHTPSKATLIICRAQRNPLFLIYFVSVYQLSLVAHTHTHTHTNKHTHTCNAGENKHSSDLPSSGALWALCEISVDQDKSRPGNGTKAPASHFSMSFSKSPSPRKRQHSSIAQSGITHTIRKRFSASPQTPSHLPPSEQHWSDPGVGEVWL